MWVCVCARVCGGVPVRGIYSVTSFYVPNGGWGEFVVFCDCTPFFEVGGEGGAYDWMHSRSAHNLHTCIN